MKKQKIIFLCTFFSYLLFGQNELPNTQYANLNNYPPAENELYLLLIDANADTVLRRLNYNDEINLTYDGTDLNIAAVSNINVDSIKFDFNWIITNTEHEAPYALAGDIQGNFKSWTPRLGRHTIKATAFANNNTDVTVATETVVFYVRQDTDNDGTPDIYDNCPDFNDALLGTPCDDNNPNTAYDVYTAYCVCEGFMHPQILFFQLIDGYTDLPVRILDHNMYTESILLPYFGFEVNIAVVLNTNTVGSVELDWDPVALYSGDRLLIDRKIEHAAPYALAGDNNGDYKSWHPGRSISEGPSTLIATAYSNTGATGISLDRAYLSLYFYYDDWTGGGFKCPVLGQACDDNNPCTIDDVYIECVCRGTPNLDVHGDPICEGSGICPIAIDINETPPKGTYRAIDSIRVNVPLANNAEIDLRAGQSLSFTAGFYTTGNSGFSAKIEACK